MVTHDPRTAGHADEVHLLRDGTVHAALDVAEPLHGRRAHRSHPRGAVRAWCSAGSRSSTPPAPRPRARAPRVRSGPSRPEPCARSPSCPCGACVADRPGSRSPAPAPPSGWRCSTPCWSRAEPPPARSRTPCPARPGRRTSSSGRSAPTTPPSRPRSWTRWRPSTGWRRRSAPSPSGARCDRPSDGSRRRGHLPRQRRVRRRHRPRAGPGAAALRPRSRARSRPPTPTRSWWPARSPTTSTWPPATRSPSPPRRAASWSRSRGSSTRRAPGSAFQGAVGYTSTATAQRMFGKGDVITGVEVVLADGVDTDALDRRAPRRARRVAHHPGRRGRHRRLPRVHHRDQQRPDADVGDRRLRGRVPRVPHLLGGGRRAHPDLRDPPRARGRPQQVRRIVLTEAGRARLRREPRRGRGRPGHRGRQRRAHRVAARARPPVARAAARPGR